MNMTNADDMLISTSKDLVDLWNKSPFAWPEKDERISMVNKLSKDIFSSKALKKIKKLFRL